jgi:hypothetical protein
MLDHGMTAAFGIMGLCVLAITGPANLRFRMLAGAIAVAAAVAVLCTPWPWFGFWAAVRWKGDLHYWFSAYFVKLELTQWIVPAVGCSIFALPLIRRPLVRVGLVGGVLSVAVGASSLVTKSPTFARFPLPGLIYFHLMVGLFAHESRIFELATWKNRLRSMIAPPEQAGYSILQVALVIVLFACLEPEARLIVSKPYLLRPYLAKLLHRPDRQEKLPRDLPILLQNVGENDVVLSDLMTSWLVPSTNGKIVAALHYELFVPDQRQRSHDLADFFQTDQSVDRGAIIRKYGVRWIVLNHENLDQKIFDALLKPRAVVERRGELVLMDANSWLGKPPATKP